MAFCLPEPSTSKSCVVFYHKNCRDGFASAAVADLFYRDGVKPVYHALDPGVKLLEQLPPILAKLPPDQQLWFLDLGFSPQGIDLIKQAGFTDYFIIDHHKTTFEAFPHGLDPEHFYFDNAFCGCVLTWKFFMRDDTEIPIFLLYVQDRDLWINTQPDSNQVNEGLFSLINPEYDAVTGEPVFTKWHQFMSTQSWLEQAKSLGSMMLEQKQRSLDFLKRNVATKSIFMTPIGNFNIMLANVTSSISDLGHVLSSENPDTFCTVMYRIVGVEVFFSLRSVGESDTTTISKLYGGGGHKNASGFSCKFHQLQITPTTFEVLDESVAPEPKQD